MRFLNKKGISPLIATVLLIGFAVALAAVVITWGSGFVERVTLSTEERTTKSIVCTSDLNFEVKKVDCGTEDILIDNKGDVNIERLTFRFFGVAGDHLGNFPTSNGVNGFEIKSFNINDGINMISIPTGTAKVEALATIKIADEDVVCSDTIRTKLVSPAC